MELVSAIVKEYSALVNIPLEINFRQQLLPDLARQERILKLKMKKYESTDECPQLNKEVGALKTADAKQPKQHQPQHASSPPQITPSSSSPSPSPSPSPSSSSSSPTGSAAPYFPIKLEDITLHLYGGLFAYKMGANVVDQAFGSIRTVASFTSEKQAFEEYSKSSQKGYRSGVQGRTCKWLRLGISRLIYSFLQLFFGFLIWGKYDALTSLFLNVLSLIICNKITKDSILCHHISLLIRLKFYFDIIGNDKVSFSLCFGSTETIVKLIESFSSIHVRRPLRIGLLINMYLWPKIREVQIFYPSKAMKRPAGFLHSEGNGAEKERSIW
ncbi:uncharacterized protein LOC132613455 [Lycium barbarum]|uniref:uncharacterized protein LOC132613455 n=1 Tax=Lycium barbarum TaxID=112863 RepID=UPI00293E0AC8|nr:uncharacterized protein LOC132613455 [Lycium barbarum]